MKTLSTLATAKFIDGAGFEKSFSFYIIASLLVFTDETDENVFNTKAFFCKTFEEQTK